MADDGMTTEQYLIWHVGIDLSDSVPCPTLDERIFEEKKRLNDVRPLAPIIEKFYDMLAQFVRELGEAAGPEAHLVGTVEGRVELQVKKPTYTH